MSTKISAQPNVEKKTPETPEKILKFKLKSNVDFVPYTVMAPLPDDWVCIPKELASVCPKIKLSQWRELQLLWVKNVKIHDDIGEETMCFSVDICWSPLKHGARRYWYSKHEVVGHAKNFGHGGSTNIYWTDRTAQKEIEAMIKNLGTILGDFEPLESYINTAAIIEYERCENSLDERIKRMNSDRTKIWSKELYVAGLPMVHTDIRKYLDQSFRISHCVEIKEDAINEIWSEDFRTLKTDLLISQNDPLSKPEDRRKILLNTMVRHALAFSDDFLFNKPKDVKSKLSPLADCLRDEGYDLSFLAKEERKNWYKVLANEAYEKAVELRKKIVYPNAR